MRLAGYVARREKNICVQGLYGGELRERDNLEGLGIDGKVILKWIFKQ